MADQPSRAEGTERPGANLGALRLTLVSDQFAAAPGEDGGRLVKHASAGREPSHAAVVWEHGPADRNAGGSFLVFGFFR
jgi:hypothetical protein